MKVTKREREREREREAEGERGRERDGGREREADFVQYFSKCSILGITYKVTSSVQTKA